MTDSIDDGAPGAIPQTDIVFPQFFALPKSVCSDILSKWTCNTFQEMAKLDVAFCNKSQRDLWVTASRDCEPLRISNGSTPKETRYIKFLAWLSSRHLSARSIFILDTGRSVITAMLAAARAGTFTNAETLHINSFRASKRKGEKSVLGDVLSQLTSLTTVDIYSSISAEDLRQLILLLPCPEKVTRITQRLDSLSLRDLCPNLTSLSLRATNVTMYTIVAECAQLVRLETLDIKIVSATEVHAPVVTTAVPAVTAATTAPAVRLFHPPLLLPSITRVAVYLEHFLGSLEESEQSQVHVFVLDLLSSCPILTDVFLSDVTRPMMPWKKLLSDVLSRIKSFSYDSPVHGLRWAMTAAAGETLSVSESALHLLSTEPGDRTIAWRNVLETLQHTNTTSFRIHLRVAGVRWWTAEFMSKLSSVTEVEIYEQMKTDSSFYITLFSLPCLTTLKYSIDEGVIRSMSSGLAECISQSVRSPRLTTIEYNGSVDFTPIITPLPTVCPVLQVLRCSIFGSVSAAAGLVDAVCRFSTLQQVEVPCSVIQNMTAAHWQQLSLHSSCRRWRSYILDPSKVRKIAESMKRLLESIAGVKVRVFDQILLIVLPSKPLPVAV